MSQIKLDFADRQDIAEIISNYTDEVYDMDKLIDEIINHINQKQ